MEERNCENCLHFELSPMKNNGKCICVMSKYYSDIMNFKESCEYFSEKIMAKKKDKWQTKVDRAIEVLDKTQEKLKHEYSHTNDNTEIKIGLTVFWLRKPETEMVITEISDPTTISKYEKFRKKITMSPKKNLDFKDFAQAQQDERIQPPVYFEDGIFRKIKAVKKSQKAAKSKNNPFRDPNSPDMQLLKSIPDLNTIRREAEQFLNQTDHPHKTAVYCPECGAKLLPSAQFCSEVKSNLHRPR